MHATRGNPYLHVRTLGSRIYAHDHGTMTNHTYLRMQSRVAAQQDNQESETEQAYTDPFQTEFLTTQFTIPSTANSYSVLAKVGPIACLQS